MTTRNAKFWLMRELRRTGQSLEALQALLTYHETILKSVDDPTRVQQVALLKQMIAKKQAS